MTAQSVSIPWRKLKSWQTPIATYLLHQYHLSPDQADRATRQLILALVWLYLWERKGFTDAPLQSCQGNQAYAKLLQSLATLHTRLGLPDLFAQLTQFELEESLLQKILTDLHSVEVAKPIVSNLPEVIASALLGQVYEQMLGQSIASSTTKRPAANSIKKSAGSFYTPPAIVQFMLQSTLPRLLPDQQSSSDPSPRLRLLDPACGSGAFLVAAYRYLLDWYLQQYLTQDHTALPNQTSLQLSEDGHWQLTQTERERILLTHIFGVDIDPQAVIVTQLCLWIALVENLPNPIERSLPALARNVQPGNALTGRTHSKIGKKGKLNNPELLWGRHLACPVNEIEPFTGDLIPDPKQEDGLQDRSPLHTLCPFDWEKAFPEILSDGGFDLVLGNPPYIDSEGMMLHLAEWRTYCGQHYRTAQGNWDLFCIFIEKATELCRPGGLTSLIVPNQLASAPYARIARQILSQENQLLLLRDYSQVPVFAASVYPLVYVAEKTPPQPGQSVDCETMQDLHQIQSVRSLPLHAAPPEAPWLLTATPAQSTLLLRLQQTFPAFSTIAQVTGAATVEEAYRIQPLICDHPEPTPADLRLVNSGTVSYTHLTLPTKA
jgi:hypothetical protein